MYIEKREELELDMKKLTNEQLTKLEDIFDSLYELHDELSTDFDGNYKDAQMIHSLFVTANQLETLYYELKENK